MTASRNDSDQEPTLPEHWLLTAPTNGDDGSGGCDWLTSAQLDDYFAAWRVQSGLARTIAWPNIVPEVQKLLDLAVPVIHIACPGEHINELRECLLKGLSFEAQLCWRTQHCIRCHVLAPGSQRWPAMASRPDEALKRYWQSSQGETLPGFDWSGRAKETSVDGSWVEECATHGRTAFEQWAQHEARRLGISVFGWPALDDDSSDAPTEAEPEDEQDLKAYHKRIRETLAREFALRELARVSAGSKQAAMTQGYVLDSQASDQGIAVAAKSKLKDGTKFVAPFEANDLGHLTGRLELTSSPPTEGRWAQVIFRTDPGPTTKILLFERPQPSDQSHPAWRLVLDFQGYDPLDAEFQEYDSGRGAWVYSTTAKNWSEATFRIVPLLKSEWS